MRIENKSFDPEQRNAQSFSVSRLILLLATGVLLAWSYHECDTISVSYKRGFYAVVISRGTVFLVRELAPITGYPSEPFEAHLYRERPATAVEEKDAQLRFDIAGLQFFYAPIFGRRRYCLLLPPWLTVSFDLAWALLACELLRRHLRRRQTGPAHCIGCSYDLTGNVSGVCPECGISILRNSEAAA